MSALEIVLAEVPEETRRLPGFKQGLDTGLRAQAYEALLDDLEERRRAARQPQAKPVVVSRRTTTAGNEHISKVPCCGRTVRFAVVEDDDESQRTAVCCRCKIIYEVELVEEELDGWSEVPTVLAEFTVSRAGVTAAVHRSGEHEQRLLGQPSLTKLA